MSEEKKSPASQPQSIDGLDTVSNLCITGVLLAKQNDTLSYVSKKTNQQIEAVRDILIMQCPFGIVLVRSFQTDSAASDIVKSLETGKTYTLPIQSYQIDNGVKNAGLKVGK